MLSRQLGAPCQQKQCEWPSSDVVDLHNGFIDCLVGRRHRINSCRGSLTHDGFTPTNLG